MPVVRYFFFVGGVLLALLLLADAYLPKMPVEARAEADLPVIRIHSDRKWPQAVVFDTSHPTIVPAQTQASVFGAATVADLSSKAGLRGAFAQLQPADQTQAQLPSPKKPDAKPVHKRRVAKRHTAPVMLVAQQPQFGLFGNNTW